MSEHTLIPVPGKPIGRRKYQDPRNLRYPFKAPTVTLTSVAHVDRLGTVLDQGDLGSCTGNATVDALGFDPFFSALSAGQQASLNEALAVKFYSLATTTDSFPGQYPPTDTGSDGPDAAKAAQTSGYISGWTHALSLNDALAALVLTPVIIGIDWYEGFDNPPANGVVSISGQIRGGHEVCLWKIDVENQLVWFKNSWTSSWGVNGTAAFSFSTLGTLLSSDGDCTVFVPLNQPAPTPTPVPPTPTPPGPTPTPTPDANDTALWTATKAWANARHIGSNKTAATAVKTWAKAKGLS